MPTILILFGLKFRIYVRDHEPIHVHVVSQDGEAKFKVNEKLPQKSIERSQYDSKKIMVCR